VAIGPPFGFAAACRMLPPAGFVIAGLAGRPGRLRAGRTHAAVQVRYPD
jgi:hypothetical protein